MPSKARVLLVTSGRGSVGGIQRYCVSLAKAMSAAVPVQSVELALDGSRRARCLEALRAIASFARFRPALVVLGHLGLGPLGLMARTIGTPYVVVVYGIEVWGDLSNANRRTLNHAREVWTISEFTRRQVGTTSAPIRVIGASVADAFLDVETESAEGHGLRVLTVARPADAWYKGIDTCAEAVARLRPEYDVEYRVVGPDQRDADDGPWFAVTGPAKAATRLLGRLDENQLMDEYRRATVVVLVSRFQRAPKPAGEGLGLTVLEAGALGIPAIGSSVGGTAECIVDGVTGFLVCADDVAALEGALRRLLEDAHLRNSMGRAARAFVLDRYGPAAFSDAVASALGNALDPERAAG